MTGRMVSEINFRLKHAKIIVFLSELSLELRSTLAKDLRRVVRRRPGGVEGRRHCC